MGLLQLSSMPWHSKVWGLEGTNDVGNLIQQGVNVFKAGDSDTARKLLTEAVKQFPDDERAWGWMYNVCINDEERIQCLKQIVRINPKNEKADLILRELTMSDFPLERTLSHTITTGTQESALPSLAQNTSSKKDSSTGIGLLFGLLLLAAIYGIAFLIALNWTGSITDLKSTMVTYQLGVMFAITLIAVPGLNPQKRDFLRYVGIFILSLAPVVGWIVIYWAGKGLARSLTRQDNITSEPKSNNNWAIALLMIFSALILFIIVQTQNERVIYEQSRITPVVKNTPVPTPTYRPTYTVAEKARFDDLFALETELVKCGPSENGATLVLTSRLTNPKQYQINNVILKGRLCAPDGCGYDDSLDPFYDLFQDNPSTPQSWPTNFRTISEKLYNIGDIPGNSQKIYSLTLQMPIEKKGICSVEVYIKP